METHHVYTDCGKRHQATTIGVPVIYDFVTSNFIKFRLNNISYVTLSK
jgi:hypothetical protein